MTATTVVAIFVLIALAGEGMSPIQFLLFLGAGLVILISQGSKS